MDLQMKGNYINFRNLVDWVYESDLVGSLFYDFMYANANADYINSGKNNHNRAINSYYNII